MSRSEMIKFVMEKNNVTYAEASVYVDSVILGVK